MVLQPGARLGSYEILSALGAGGMGEVFRARDTRLNRDVAIKVLPALFATDPERLSRFEREAQALAALNHPNIAQIYGVIENPPALVMEFVDGRTLDQVIPTLGLPLADTLKLGIQMADALAAAHAAGIVHRDFKPGNVVVTPSGAAKVLDFGLAKVAEAPAFGATATALGAPRTEAGAVMGTVSYMSPEQAAGRPIDARSDIFSFGSVLFEMVTGKRAFDGDTSMSTLAAIIHEPAKPVTQVNAAVPRELERLIARCHRKDPARRVQSMADLRSALEELRDDLDAGRLSGSTPVAPASVARRRMTPLLMAAGGLLLLAAGLFAGRTWLARAAPPESRFTLERMTADPGVTTDPAVTASGDLIAYASDRQDGTNLDIWVQPTAGGDPVRVTTDPADDSEPAFSPDGSRIAFRSEREGGGIYVVPALGGGERLLVPYGRRPRFSPDGKWLLYETGGRGVTTAVYIMPATGGVAQQVGSEIATAQRSLWSPDSTRILVLALKGSVRDFWLARVDEHGIVKQPTTPTGVWTSIESTGISATEVVAWADGRVVVVGRWGPGGGIVSVPMAGDVAGGSARVVYQTTERITGAALAASGRIFFASQTDRTSLAALRVDGTRPASSGPEPITQTVAADSWPSFSSDGAKVAFSSTRRGQGIWVRDVQTGRETALPVPDTSHYPVISPDGRSVAFMISDAANSALSDVALIDTRGGVLRKLCERCARYVSSWTPDGRHVLLDLLANNVSHLAVLDAAGGTPVAVSDRQRLWFGRVSPDGRWIAAFDWYAPDRTREVVAPFSAGKKIDADAWVPLTDGQGDDEESAWSADSRTLYFVSGRDGFRCIYAVGIDPSAGKPLGAPTAILHLHGTRRTILSTSTVPGRLDAAAGRLVFPVHQVEGNIWSLSPK